MAQLSLSVLGAFQARLNGNALTAFESDKARALLAFLAVEADRPHSRAQLAGLFWPEWPEETARSNLRHALANLRRLLDDRHANPPFLWVTRQTLQFNRNSDAHVDAAALQAKLAAHRLRAGEVYASETLQRLQAAVDHYHAPFLSGFYLDGCAAFEEWVLLTRERLQRQVLETLRFLSDHFEQQGEYTQALQSSRRRVDLEPWLEEAHYQVIRLLARTGQRSAALAQYEQCRRMLADELGVTPSEETAALVEQIKTVQDSEESRSFRAMLDFANRRLLPKPQEVHPVTPRYNLPLPPTPLLGRDHELQTIGRLFHQEGARLVTLTGTGGVGKTRLAMQAARDLLDAYPAGVYFVALAAIREPALVIAAIAETLDVREIGGRPLLERVQAHLRAAAALLLLDNFEHVAAAAPVVSELLAACPSLHVLCTSREALHLRGEYEVVVPPLPVPANPSQVDHAGLAAFAAVELFRQRAVAVKHGFVLDADSAPAVVQLCARLDGLPLAIELAAARLKLLSPQALVQRLAGAASSSLRFLRADTRDAPSRHRSLWDTIAWSYELLSTDEQSLFRRMAVFVGGCTLAAAANVCTDDADADLLDQLSSLLDKNLIHQDEQGDGELRFRMLETLREFGLEQLKEHAELSTVQRRHAEYYLTLAEEANSYMQTPSQLVWLDRLDAEHNNVRAALLWATENALDLGLRLGAALSRAWIRRGYHQETLARLTALLQRCQGQEPRSPLEDVIYHAGLFSIRLSTLTTAYAYFEQAAEVSRKTGNRYRLSYAVTLMGHLKHDQGDYAAADRLFAEGLQLAYEVEDAFGIAMVLSHKGRMRAERGKLDEGRRWSEQGMAMHREIGDRWGSAIALRNLGLVRRFQGDLDDAQTLFEEAIQLGRELGDDSTIATDLYELGCVYLEQGNLEMSRALLVEALRIMYQIDTRSRIADSLDALAQMSVLQDQPEHGVRLAGAAAAIRATVGFVLAPLYQAKLDHTLQAARQALGEEAAATAWAEGQQMTVDEAVSFALSN
jgi:predicted ATPase/DNA-binding SARP family transcriptional activator